MAAAPLAHRGFRGHGHLQLGFTLETPNQPLLDNGFGEFGLSLDRFMQSEMGATLFADGRVRAHRLGLAVPAFGAGDRDKILFGGWHGLNNAPAGSSAPI